MVRCCGASVSGGSERIALTADFARPIHAIACGDGRSDAGGMNALNVMPLTVVAIATPVAVAAAVWLATAEAGPRAAARRAVLAADRVLTGAAMLAACAALAIATAAGFWQVVARFALDSPAAWSEALVRTALIWMCFLGLAGTLRAGAMVSIDMAHRYSRGAVRRAIEAASLAASLSLMGVLFWFGWMMAERVQFQEMAGLEVSMSWGYAAIPVGALFAMLGAFAHMLDRRAEELDNAI
jgi:TRAP-type C4-dicarboxylate transport system permease small subunit